MPKSTRKLVVSRLLPEEVKRLNEVCANEAMTQKRPVGKSEMLALLISRAFEKIRKRG